MGGGIMIDRGWWCWLEVPVASPGFGASPVFVEQVTPLGSLHAISLKFLFASRQPIGVCD